MTDWIDISRSLSSASPPWPGDTPFVYRLNWNMTAGASVNVGAVTMGTHNGTHADAPSHFQPGGVGIDALDLTAFVGPAVVVDVRGREVIQRSDLEGREEAIRRTRRVLLKTGAWSDPAVFPTSIPTMAPGVPTVFGELGVVLVGVDVPSVDSIDSAALPNHHALAAAGICILESLDLVNVAAGEYELIALPLKITGGDASPLRAVLRPPALYYGQTIEL